MNITAIYWPGVVHAVPGGQYDPTRPQKLWSLPVSAWPPDAKASDTFTAVAVATQTGVQTSLSMSYSEAAAVNVYNAGSLGNPPAEVNAAQVPWPVDLALLKPGQTIKADPMAIFGVLPDIVEPAAIGTPDAPATVDLSAVITQLQAVQATQTRILNGLNFVLSAMAQPKV